MALAPEVAKIWPGQAGYTSPGALVLLASKLAIGLTQAGAVIYAPVWIDEFAPDGSSAGWLAGCQAAIAFGIFVGYMTAAFVFFGLGLHWKWAIWIQVVGMLPICAFLFIAPRAWVDDRLAKRLKEKYNPDRSRDQRPSDEALEVKRDRGLSTASASSFASRISVAETASFCSSVKELIFDPMWMMLVLCLCSLFFVVTGVQFWTTKFFREAFDPPLSIATIVAAFMIIAATGPIGGVIMGGIVVDLPCIGGYKTREAQCRCISFCTSLALLASISGLLAGFDRNPYRCGALMWLQLFFGGAILPAMTGMIVAGVRYQLRSFASALSMALYNLLGYAGGGILPGVVMQFFGWGIRDGMKCVFASAIVGLMTCGGALAMSRRRVLEERRWFKEAGINRPRFQSQIGNSISAAARIRTTSSP
jgi:MFS family permease